MLGTTCVARHDNSGNLAVVLLGVGSRGSDSHIYKIESLLENGTISLAGNALTGGISVLVPLRYRRSAVTRDTCSEPGPFGSIAFKCGSDGAPCCLRAAFFAAGRRT